MTSLVNYRKTGRVVIAGYAWYKFSQAVQDGSLLGATSWGIVAVEATVGVFFPDPVATFIGGVTVKTVSWLRSFGMDAFTWAYKNPAKSGLILFIVLMPFGIRERQKMKQEQSLEDWDAGLGEAMWKAQTVPNTERIRVPTFPDRVF